MRSALALAMMLLLVHAQVAGAACLCIGGHAEAHHPHDADGDDDAGAREPHEVSPAGESEDDDHGGPSHCECAPSQPIAAPEAAPEAPRAISWAPAFLDVPAAKRAQGLEGDLISDRARPPPVGGVSSSSPFALPVLLF